MAAIIHKLSIVDQQSYPCYVRMPLFFPLQTSVTETTIIENLQKSLDELQNAMPWVAGGIRREPKYHNDFVLVTHPSDKLTLIVDHPGDELPQYSQLSAQRMPQRLLDPKLFSKIPVFPDPSQEQSPIFALQANFLNGALALTFVTHHNIFDGTATGNLIGIFARLYSGHELSPAEIEACCPIELRHSMLRGNELGPEPCTMVSINGLVQYQITNKNAPPPEYHPAAPAKPTGKVVFFPVTKLAELKEACKPSDTESWISTNDAICALIWSRLTKAKYPQSSNNTSTPESTILVTPINIRNRSIPLLPKSYLGNAFLDVLTTLPTKTLTTSPLSTIATTYRKTVAAVTPTYINDTISLFRSVTDDTVVSPGNRDLLITSWAEMPAYTADFGPNLGGKPEWVRALFHAGFANVVILLPKKENGLEVVIFMDEAVCGRLLEDEVFMRYVEYVTD